MSTNKPADTSDPIKPASTPPQHRIALCVGNAAYSRAPLTNPVHDAAAFAAYLRRQLAFTVDLACNVDKYAMEVAVERLLSAIQPNSVVVLYFAGHGCEVDGVNYLLPILDCGAMSDADLRNRGVSAQWMQEKVWERKPAFLLFVLDCCRENPFRGTRNGGGGLGVMKPLGSLLLYACAPGQLASDGVGSQNSPLTTHLIQHLHVGEIHSAIRRVIKAVCTSTDEKQQPWTHSDMKDDFYWDKAEASAAPQASPDVLPANLSPSPHSISPSPQSPAMAPVAAIATPPSSQSDRPTVSARLPSAPPTAAADASAVTEQLDQLDAYSEQVDVESIARLMKEHPAEVEVQLRACDSLTSLARNGDQARRERIVSAGVIECIVAAMRQLAASDERVQPAACSALRWISVGSGAARQRLLFTGAFECVTTAMRQQQSNVQLQEDAVCVLAATALAPPSHAVLEPLADIVKALNPKNKSLMSILGFK